MYVPSHKLCRLLIESSFKHIQAHIGQETGISPTLEELFEHYNNSHVISPSISNDVYSVIDEVYAEGLAYTKMSGDDCHVLLIDRFKVIDGPIRKRMAERLSPEPNCDMTRVTDLLGVELYDYMKYNANTEGTIFMAGDLYLACVPSDRICAKNFTSILS